FSPLIRGWLRFRCATRAKGDRHLEHTPATQQQDSTLLHNHPARRMARKVTRKSAPTPYKPANASL
ncbi:hypothetical protein, partial [Enterobacter hormaechei]|uniref:hypothetical protein n=1 Tax=Enterobacter hormaechei TaxID=158836 RepID=UPI001F34D9DF